MNNPEVDFHGLKRWSPWSPDKYAMKPWEHGSFAFGSSEPIKICPGDSRHEIPLGASRVLVAPE